MHFFQRQLNWSMARSVLQLSGLLARRGEQIGKQDIYWVRHEQHHSTLIPNKKGGSYVVSSHNPSRSLVHPDYHAAMARALPVGNVQNGTIKIMVCETSICASRKFDLNSSKNGTTMCGYLCKDEANRMEVCVNGTAISIVPTDFTSQSATPSNGSDVALQMEGGRCITYDPNTTSYLYSSECSWGGNQTFLFDSATSRLQPIPQISANSTAGSTPSSHNTAASQINSRDDASDSSQSVTLVFVPETGHMKPKEASPDAASTTVLTMTATTTLTITSTATATSASDVTLQAAITTVSASSSEIASSASSSPSTSASDATVSTSSVAALEIEMITPASQVTMSSTALVSSSTVQASFTNPSDGVATSSASPLANSSSVAPPMSSASGIASSSSSVAMSSVVSATPSMMLATFADRNQRTFKAESM